MIPTPFVSLVLVLGVFRLCRLVGWDDFPPVARARDWIVGATLEQRGSANARMGLTNEEVISTTVFRRPTLEHFLHCPYCVGFWISVATYLAWLEEPRWTLYALAPFALNGAVGIVSRMLDP